MAHSEAELSAEQQSEAQRRIGWKGLLKAIALVSLVVLVEVVAAAVLIPSAQDAESTARQLVAAQQGELAAADTSGVSADVPAAAEQTIEVELGRYNVTRYDPQNDTTLIVDFELFGVVLQEDASEFANAREANKVRLREQVIITMSGAEATDFSDSELGLIKRRILEKTNRALGKPLVREILFSKFNFVER